MPRTARASVGGVCYHVFNCGNNRAEVFHEDDDYAGFVELFAEACQRRPIRLLSYCLMPDHFHLALWPRAAGDLSRWMQWLLTAHVRRYRSAHGGLGHVWQGRFKAFPIQPDEHLLTVLRYIEGNPVRARRVRRAERWRWSSAPAWAGDEVPELLHAGPLDRGADWLTQVNTPLPADDLAMLRVSLARGAPFGSERWRRSAARRLGLEASMRPRGRPRQHPK